MNHSHSFVTVLCFLVESFQQICQIGSTLRVRLNLLIVQRFRLHFKPIGYIQREVLGEVFDFMLSRKNNKIKWK